MPDVILVPKVIFIIIPPVPDSFEADSAATAYIKIGQHISAVNCGEKSSIGIRVCIVIENNVIGDIHGTPVAFA